MSSIASAADKFEKQRIYRVFRLGRFLDLLKHRANTLVRPALWEDPWEEWWSGLLRKRLGATEPADVFGQCWTAIEESDAMWRIYAPMRDGVKVRTTVAALRESISDAQIGYRAMVSKVHYWADATIKKWGTGVIGHLERKNPTSHDLKDVRRALRNAQLETYLVADSPDEWKKHLASLDANEFANAVGAIGQYHHKRLAFKWEREVRLLGWFPEQMGSDTFSYPFDLMKNIHEVVFDPRMEESVCSMAKEHIRRLGLSCRAYQSRLYALDL